MLRWSCVAVVLSVLLVPAMSAEQETGFRAIFDGKSLSGWVAADMSYWSVEDGAITGRATEEHPVRRNQFLFWRLGPVDDFELKLKYRIIGTASANSGIQIRSRVEPDGSAVGYQADIDRAGKWTGAVYDEHGRGLLAARGQKTVIGADGKMTHSVIGDADELWGVVHQDGWNEYHIIACGPLIVLKINGKIMSEVVDNDRKNRDLSGAIALQLHAGPPLTVQFKDIRLRRLPLSGRKKVVFVAGGPSHGYGAHEYNAGCRLLASCLNGARANIYAATYLGGWPKDPTAFDNADAVVFYCDGGSSHLALPHLEQIDRLADRGVGIALLHYALDLPGERAAASAKRWVGGYYERYWSVNPAWTARFEKLVEHPVTEGVRPFEIWDEWYYNMRFVDQMKNVTPVLTAVPPDSTRRGPDGPHSGNAYVREHLGKAEHVAWVYERPGGGRGFGFTGGHRHWNWGHDDFRKLVLNALVWIAGAEVPAGGIRSGKVSLEQLESGLDFPRPANWDRRRQEIQQQLEQWRRGN